MAGSRSAADSSALEPIFESLDAAPAGLFAAGAGIPIAGDASPYGVGLGQTLPIVGEPWP